MIWQYIITGILFVLAAGYLTRYVWRMLSPAKGCGDQCGCGKK